MIGYKATDINGCCRGFKFEVGKTYTKDTPKEELQCCTDKVFHFCRELFAIERESNYILSKSRLFEVIAGDYVRSGDIYGTNSLTILREICGDEKKELLNTGNYNTGNYNSGNYNTGNYNSGNYNTGSYNTGNYNTGNYNTGNHNIGDCNSANYNNGNCNSGHFNCGDFNSGNYNNGNCNSGHFNCGSHNSGDFNSGYFNSDEPFVRMFNKDTKLKRSEVCIPQFCYFSLTEWVPLYDATEEEKEAHKEEINICGGFLRKLNYKEAWRLAWNRASKKEHLMMLALPNWDNEVFKEISGIDAEAEIAKE